MSDVSYSKIETDLKLDNLEQKIDNKFERVQAQIQAQFESLRTEMRLGFAEVSAGFRLVDKDINWLKWLTGGTFFLLLSIVVAAAIRFLF